MELTAFNLKRGLLALLASKCGPCGFYGVSRDCYWCHGAGVIIERNVSSLYRSWMYPELTQVKYGVDNFEVFKALSARTARSI
jgi:hypothetical protein